MMDTIFSLICLYLLSILLNLKSAALIVMRASICAAIILAVWYFLLPDRQLFVGSGMKKLLKFFVFFLSGSCVLCL